MVDQDLLIGKHQLKQQLLLLHQGEGYFCNTSGGAFTVNLPSSPSVGDIVAIKDYGSSFATNNLTIGRGGSNLNGDATDSIRNTDNESLTLVYADATKGWLAVEEGTGFVGESFIQATGGSSIATVGNCKIHTFTGPGTFCVTQIASCAANNIVSYVVIAGGGSGGTDVGGGGGAGGFRELKNPVTPYTASPLDGYPTPGNRVTLTATGYPITIGAGGTAPTSPPQGNSGSNSTFSTITSAGGGAGGGGPAPGTVKNGLPGGSGGGGGGWTRPAGCGGPTGPGCVGAPGAGNTPPVTPAQGSNGGTVSPGGPGWPGAGGGGATAVGVNSPGSSPLTTITAGGAGATTNITNSPVTYAAGGNGGGDQSTVPQTDVAPANSGSGGGGAGNFPTPNKGNAGGSGIVVIRYKYQ